MGRACNQNEEMQEFLQHFNRQTYKKERRFMRRWEDNIRMHFKQISNIVRMIKSRKPRWAGHATRMKECRSVQNILTGKPIRKKEDLGGALRRIL